MLLLIKLGFSSWKNSWSWKTSLRSYHGKIIFPNWLHGSYTRLLLRLDPQLVDQAQEEDNQSFPSSRVEYRDSKKIRLQESVWMNVFLTSKVLWGIRERRGRRERRDVRDWQEAHLWWADWSSTLHWDWCRWVWTVLRRRFICITDIKSYKGPYAVCCVL